MCGTGEQQSPIDLTKRGSWGTTRMDRQFWDYQNYPTGLDVTLQEHTIKVDFNDGVYKLRDAEGKTDLFTPLQFHVHSPSEHTINGKFFDVELHIVHKYKDTEADLGAVLGVMFDRTAGNKRNNFIDSLDFEHATEIGANLTDVEMKNFLRDIDTDHYWAYEGSLTTPPCTEGIRWTVLSEIQHISDEQLDQLTQYFSDDM